ncbi:hypothetical protein HK096_003605 [Nowakowskiella sp. JEL0078]|nr:hypothetical protein HK096_003605 [Nowakowskiella sp. JEL0078]
MHLFPRDATTTTTTTTYSVSVASQTATTTASNSPDIGLIITSVVFAILIVIGSVYFLVYFQHPEDKWVAWFPKIVVVNVANQKGEFQRFAIPMSNIQLGFYIATTVIVVVAVPFTIFYYEGENDDDESDNKKSGASQIGYAFKWLLPMLLLVGVGVSLMYIFIGYADIPLDVVTSGIYNSTAYNSDYCSSSGLILTSVGSVIASCKRYQTSISVRVSVLVYVVAIITIAGWLVFSVFGGVGLVVLPFDLINEFINRPKSITATEYQERKKIIGQQALLLMEAGKTLQDELKGVNGGDTQNRLGRRYRGVKNRENAFRKLLSDV